LSTIFKRIYCTNITVDTTCYPGHVSYAQRLGNSIVFSSLDKRRKGEGRREKGEGNIVSPVLN
jgi:hypothetical protein